MASRFSIESVISMVDKVSGPMGRASKSVTGFSRKMRGQFAKADITAQSLNKRMNKVGGRATKVGLAGLGVGAGLVAQQFVEFDDAIFAASAKFSDLDITTKAGQKTMEALRATARKVGADTKFNAVQAAQGLDFLAMAGFNTKQSMAALPGVVSLATVANVDLARATDIASDTLGAFNLNSKDSVILQKNLARVNDVAAKTTTMFNTNLEDLFESIKKGGPTFTAAGQSMESFSALVGSMANAGVKGSESGTQLRNMMLRLASPTTAAGNLLTKLGVKTKDSQGNFRDVIDIIGDFETGLKGMGTAQRTSTLATIFGARSVTGMNILLAEGSKKLEKYRDKLLASGGSANKMAKIIEQSFGNQIKALGSAATELGFKIFSAFSKDGKGGIKNLTEAIRNFNVAPIVETLKILFTILSAVFTVIGPFLPAIVAIVAGIKLWAIAQTALNFIMAANPIGLVIGAIFLMVSAIRFLQTTTNKAFLPMQLQLQEWIFKWAKLKLQIMQVGNALGLVSNQKLGAAIADAQVAHIEGRILAERLKQSQSSSPPIAQAGQSIGANTGNKINGSVDINVAAPKDTQVSQKGIVDPFKFSLDNGPQ